MALKGFLSLRIEGEYAVKFYNIIARGMATTEEWEGQYNLKDFLKPELGTTLLPPYSALLVRKDTVEMLDDGTLSIEIKWRVSGLDFVIYLFANCPDIKLYFLYVLGHNERRSTNDLEHKYFKEARHTHYYSQDEIKECVAQQLAEEESNRMKMASSQRFVAEYDPDLPF